MFGRTMATSALAAASLAAIIALVGAAAAVAADAPGDRTPARDGEAPVLGQDAPGVLPDRYIVVFEKKHTRRSRRLGAR